MGGTIDAYCNEGQPLDVVINIMVGDFQRLIEYPKRSLMIAQDSIPQNVLTACKELVVVGYDKDLV